MTKRAGLAFKPWTAQGEQVQNAVVRAALDAIAAKTGLHEDDAKVRTFVARWVKNNYCGAKRRAAAAKAVRRGPASGENGDASADADAPAADADPQCDNAGDSTEKSEDDDDDFGTLLACGRLAAC